MMRRDSFKVTVVFNDGTETMIYYYPTEKIADGVAKRYLKSAFVKSVEIEEI